ncbi:extracellular solute-binding protein [Hyphomicrobium sulfonivorans]|uniref:extracellular solute-binding protein n=1 Tax=Hyphomicrobium sulfonivorans TaxID=121290 RepID=UPI0030B84D32
MHLRLDAPAACLAALLCLTMATATFAQEPASPSAQAEQSAPVADPAVPAAAPPANEASEPASPPPAAAEAPAAPDGQTAAPAEAAAQEAQPTAPEAPAAQAPAAAVEQHPRHHALSLMGDPAFPEGFSHFDWVNPDAPKGGTLRAFAQGSFDSLNPFSVKGDPAGGLGLIYDSLMSSSPDEPSTEYGLIAEWVSYPPDFSSVTFGINPKARFHDGTPVTPEDVIFSFEGQKAAHPRSAFYYKNVVKAEKTGDNEVTFTFDVTGNRELPLILGQLNVVPKAFWEAAGPDGEKRDITKSTLEMPVGSGPYRIKSFDPGRGITFERVKDYWAQDLPVAKGQWNFDEFKLTYFLDRTPGFEEFKSGKIDYWQESTASQWATGYDFPAIRNGQVKKEAIPVRRVAPMQSFVFNQRRKQFQDPRVRQAFNLAFNFEEANKKLFYDSYVRVGSFFDNSELAAKGLPEGRELEILQEVKDEVPPEVFTTEWKNPVNKTPEDFRNNMREASKLLQEAGWKLQEVEVDDGECGTFCSIMRSVGLSSANTTNLLRNDKGETLNAEFLVQSPDFQKIVLPYVQDLKKLGVNASIRMVDSAQYKRREDSRDYDIIIDNFAQSESPGNEQRDFWGSAAADREGSTNTAGIRNPAIDKLIDKVVFATTREELVAATHALDRVLLWNHYVVPQWHYPYERIAYWDIFGRPDKLPSQTSSLSRVWWMDADKQKALNAVQGR